VPRLNPLLFNNASIHDVIENQKRQLADAASKLTPQELQKDDAELIEMLVRKYDAQIPVLHEDGIEVEEEEVKIDVSGDPNRIFFDRSEPHYVVGSRITVHVPFTGDGGFFNVQPSTFNMNPPRGRVDGKELLLNFEVVVERKASVKSEIDSTLRDIKEYLGWLSPSAAQLTEALRTVAGQALAKRRSDVGARSELLNSLGYPVRKKP
jgi:hypothetical protein